MSSITTWHVIAAAAVIVQGLFALAIGMAAYIFQTSISDLKRLVAKLFEGQDRMVREFSELKGEHKTMMDAGGCHVHFRKGDAA
jgi:hypothetical protein